MEFTTDAKFTNVELVPHSGASGVLYVPVKNIYSEFGDNIELNSVFDIYPGISGSMYRKEPLLRLNKTSGKWELNPYFLESNYINATIPETVPDPPDNVENPPPSQVDKPEELTIIPTINVTGDLFTNGFNLNDTNNASGSFAVTLNNTHDATVELTLSLSSDNITLSPTVLSFGPLNTPVIVTVTQIVNVELLSSTDEQLVENVTITFEETGDNFIGIETVEKTLTVIYEPQENTIQVPNILLSSGLFETGSFELGGGGSGFFILKLSKETDVDVNLTVNLNTASTYLTFDENGNEQSSKVFIFEAGEIEQIVNIYERNQNLTGFSQEIVTIVITETTTPTIGILPLSFNLSITHIPDDTQQPGAYITFNDNFSSTNFEDVNSALIPSILNNFVGFQNNDIIYVLYKGSVLNLEPAVTDSNDQSWKIVCKDLITVQGDYAYVLMQIRGITLLTSSGRLPISELRFILLRGGLFYDLSILNGAPGLTSYLNVNGISGTFDQNLLNGTIEMGNVEYFYRFEETLTLSEFVLPSLDIENAAILMMRKGIAKAPTQNLTFSNSMNSLVDNNIYSSEVIDSWMQFDENNFANPIAFYSTVKMSGKVVISPGDMLAAYVVDSSGNIEIRGVSSTDYTTTSGAGVIPWTFPGETESVNILETTIFTNALQSTEFIKFRLFKKDPYVVDGEIVLYGNSVYELAQELPVGGISGITGGMYSEGPNNANIFYIGRFSTVLNGPYDDFSFNVTLDNMNKENIFVDGSVSQLPNIKAYRSQDYTAVQVSSGIWLSNTTSDGSLFVNSPLSFKEFYSIRLMENVDKININIDGFPIKTQVSIVLNPGYNWVGYTLFRPETLQNVFMLNGNTRLDPPNSLKAIITRDQGSSLVSNGGFFGSLSQMRPGGAYVLYIDPNLPEGTTTTLNYPATYNTATVQNPSGYFKINSMVNPLPELIGDTYIYISDTEFGIAFVNPNDNSISGIKTIGTYTGFGVHDTTMTLLDPQTIEIQNLGNIVSNFEGLDGILTSIQLRAGFTALDGSNIDGANGILDFIIRKNPDPLSFSDTEPVDYKLSEIGGLLPLSQSPPFKFTAVIQNTVPNEIQSFFGNFVPVVPVVPVNPVVFEVTKLENNKLKVQINLRKIIGSNETSKYNVFELFLNNVDFGTADFENDVPVATTDNITVLSPSFLPFSILQAQGNAIQFITIEGVEFGTSPIIFEVNYVTASENINISTQSYITDINYGKYTIPEFI